MTAGTETAIAYRLSTRDGPASAEHLYTWLRHEGLTPTFGTEEGTYTLRLPSDEIPRFHALQRSNPARYGNPPEVVEALEKNSAEIALQSAIDERRRAELTAEQQKWIEDLHYQTTAHGSECLALNEALHPLCAQHYVLQWARLQADARLPTTSVLDDATDVVEQQIRTLLHGWPNITDSAFLYDARGLTVGVCFASGAYTSLNGSYKVPLHPHTVEAYRADIGGLCQRLLATNTPTTEPAAKSIPLRGISP